MADVVNLPLSGSAVLAARLINFATGHSNLLPTHLAWLDNFVAPLLPTIEDPWVDLYGFASHLGSASFNQKLSFDRCEAVRARIASYGSKVSFPNEIGFGESRSAGGALDNSGAWRAVEVTVHRTKPAPKPVPKPYDHKVKLHFRSVAMPKVPEFTALANAQKVYDQYKILLEFASGLSMGVTNADLDQLNASDGTCQWNQASDEQKLLDALGGRNGVGPNDVVVYYVNEIKDKTDGPLRGCAGHAPARAAVVVSTIGSQWTLAHELGHVLLGPGFSPTHVDDDTTNIMHSPTTSITADPPVLTAKQLETMRASRFVTSI